ncbi:DNA-binding transcriptional regulator of glucitol operon [Tamaricihabitans halophyticus]|uniref:DNA-binding transcriptional regulator of glucitol operon n=1 Tax=Tamaricihabitans halophyticus TaxID=1262583 RepID=A0A4R2R3S0_9PSEU|nr:transcriptional regulator GutM [Tamaricihabitans halophyticus]TCP54025.1 DNA-binding transcriptional regulator of glucitol operon [Tamaricihabitans halophyticus]
MSWQAVVLLVGGFVVAGIFSWLQHYAYQRTVNQVATEENRSGVVLVTGRGKGKLRGAVVLLVIDRRGKEVRRALAMRGASVFARFQERPELCGPLDGLADREQSKMLRKAIEDAVANFKRVTAGARPAVKA